MSVINDTVGVNKKTFVFDENKKGSKTILGLLEFFKINQSFDVTLNYIDDVDTISQRVIEEYKLDVKVNDLKLFAALMPDSHNSSGIYAYYFFIFIMDDLLIFKGIDYTDLINALEEKEHNLPPLVSEMLTICMNYCKTDFEQRYELIRTEIIIWATAVNQQLQQRSFNQNEYFIFKLKCHASYHSLLMMFMARNIKCTYLEYRKLQTTYEMVMFYINELASSIREKSVGEISSVDKFFNTSDFSRISEYCAEQLYKTVREFEGKCNLMASLEFLRLCKNTVIVHLTSERYENNIDVNIFEEGSNSTDSEVETDLTNSEEYLYPLTKGQIFALTLVKSELDKSDGIPRHRVYDWTGLETVVNNESMLQSIVQ
ncbi:33461_t:CDS:2, partial [Gigaspora margarita]